MHATPRLLLASILEHLADRAPRGPARLRWLNWALKLAPNNATLLSKRSEAKGIGAGDADHAAALALSPNDPMVHVRRSSAFKHAAFMALYDADSRRPEVREPLLRAAVACASDALALAPLQERALVLRLSCFMQLNQLDNALQDARFLVTTFPGNAQHLATLGAILAERGDYREALEILFEALRLDWSHSRAHAWSSYCFLKTGDREAARRSAEAALVLDPYDDGAHAVWSALEDGNDAVDAETMRGGAYQ